MNETAETQESSDEESWKKAGWDELLNSLDEEAEKQEEQEEKEE
jgi:hypothetical protein